MLSSVKRDRHQSDNHPVDHRDRLCPTISMNLDSEQLKSPAITNGIDEKSWEELASLKQMGILWPNIPMSIGSEEQKSPPSPKQIPMAENSWKEMPTPKNQRNQSPSNAMINVDSEKDETVFVGFSRASGIKCISAEGCELESIIQDVVNLSMPEGTQHNANDYGHHALNQTCVSQNSLVQIDQGAGEDYQSPCTSKNCGAVSILEQSNPHERFEMEAGTLICIHRDDANKICAPDAEVDTPSSTFDGDDSQWISISSKALECSP